MSGRVAGSRTMAVFAVILMVGAPVLAVCAFLYGQRIALAETLRSVGAPVVVALGSLVVASIVFVVGRHDRWNGASSDALAMLLTPDVVKARDLVGTARSHTCKVDRAELRSAMFVLMWTVQRVAVAVQRGNVSHTRDTVRLIFAHVEQIVEALNEAALNQRMRDQEFADTKQMTAAALDRMSTRPSTLWGGPVYGDARPHLKDWAVERSS